MASYGSVLQWCDNPRRSSSVQYFLRLSLHNGRTFVGPTVQSGPLAMAASPGYVELALQSPHLTLDWLLVDALTVLVIELHAFGGGAAGSGGGGLSASIGSLVLAPFTAFAPDGSNGTLKAGLHRCGGRPLVGFEVSLVSNESAALNDTVKKPAETYSTCCYSLVSA